MEAREQVGVTAGEVWHVLNDFGPQTVAQLKKRLNGSGELVGFALGWLAREDKIDISLEKKKNFKIALK
ncbi:MAG: winged helix-turn-helix domain-containing protein [Terriglobia bacterium]